MLLAPLYGAQGVILATGLMTAAGFICYLVCLMRPFRQSLAVAPREGGEE
jgi:hypothetical protein